MALSNDFASYFAALPFNDEGNRNTKAFTEAMIQESEKAMMKMMTDDQNYVLFGADSRGRIRIIHSVKNLEAQCSKAKINWQLSLGLSAMPSELSWTPPSQKALNLACRLTPTSKDATRRTIL